MASPQLENGYTQLSNELLEAIIKYPFGKRSLKIILIILRETYGWHRKKKQISFGKIAEKAPIDRRNVIYTCNILFKHNILFKQKLKNNKNIWGINKNYEEWLMPDGKTLFREYEFQFKERKLKQAQWQKIWIKNKFPELTEILAEEIEELLKKYSEQKFIEALKIAVKQNNKKLAYIEGILKRMSSEEKQEENDATGKTQISDGRWLTDEELAEEEMKGNIYYERKTNKWICINPQP